VKLFQLDRCYIETKYKLKSNDLVVINLHLSAFDKGGFLRKKQLEYLKKHILNEYEKGNYVLVGGDWNHIFPGVDLKAINENNIPKDVPTLSRNWIPNGWKLAFDSTIPTNRSNNHPYVEGENTVTIIDGFLLSPNIKLLEVRGINLHFNDSDHNPVFFRIALQ
jgi:exonuclease III